MLHYQCGEYQMAQYPAGSGDGTFGLAVIVMGVSNGSTSEACLIVFSGKAKKTTLYAIGVAAKALGVAIRMM